MQRIFWVFISVTWLGIFLLITLHSAVPPCVGLSRQRHDLSWLQSPILSIPCTASSVKCSATGIAGEHTVSRCARRLIASGPGQHPANLTPADSEVILAAGCVTFRVLMCANCSALFNTLKRERPGWQRGFSHWCQRWGHVAESVIFLQAREGNDYGHMVRLFLDNWLANKHTHKHNISL